MKFFKIFILYLFILNTFGIKAEDTPEYSLYDLLLRAEERADIILATQASVEEAEFLKKQAGKFKNPSVKLDYGRRRASNESGAEYAVEVSQDFYYPGKRDLKVKVAEESQKSLEVGLEEKKLEYRFSFIKLVYSYLIAKEKASHIKDRIKRFKFMDSFIRNKPFITPESKAQLFIVQNRLLALHKHLIELERNKLIEWEKLNFFLELNSPVKIKTVWFQKGMTLEKETIIKEMLEKNSILKRSKISIQKSTIEAKLANLEKYSDFKIQGALGEDRSGVANKFFDFGVTFNIPILDRNQNQIKSIESRVRSESHLFDYQTKLLLTKLSSAILEYESIKEILKKFNFSFISEMETKLNYADIEFQKGRLSLVSYLELEIQLHETHHAIYDTQLDYIDKYTQILFLTNNPEFKGE
jgi:outer membrane protein TolC